MDVAGAQLDRALQQIVERAHHRRAAGEIAQALDVVVGLLRPVALGVLAFAVVGSMRWSSTVVMSSNEATATSTGAPNTISAARMAAVSEGSATARRKSPFGARNGKIVDSRRKRRENPSRHGVAASNCGRPSRTSRQ